MVTARQRRFLANFANSGTIRRAAKDTGVDRQTIYNWIDADNNGFRNELALARDDFAERVEGKLFDNVLDTDKPNPILLMFTMKAHNRAKYGDSVTVTNDAAHELLAAVRGLPSGGVVVDGDVVDVSGEEMVRDSMGR